MGRGMDAESDPDPVDVEVGRRLRALRQQKGWSLEAFGIVLGVSYQQVQKYETGANRVSASKLVKAARALGVGLGAILPDEDDPAFRRSTERLVLDDPDLEELIANFALIPLRHRKGLLLLARSLTHDPDEDDA
jgi:transcriptional regulator with XRE-family HTH domain